MAIFRARILAGLLLFSTLPALGQRYGIVEGYVNGPDGKPFEGALVQFNRIWEARAAYEMKTDKKGYFRFLQIEPGSYTVAVMVDGEVRYKMDQMTVSAGRQDNVQGNLASNWVIKLKSAQAAAAEGQKEVTPEQKKQMEKNADDNKKKNAAIMDTFTAGRQALDKRDYDAALQNLSKAAELDPRQAAVWGALSDTYLALGRKNPAEADADYAKAREALDKAVALAPADGGYWNNWALGLAAGNRLDEARAALARAIEVDPAGAAKYHFNLGVSFLNAGKSQQAVDEFKLAIGADSNYAEAHYQYGVALLSKATVDAAGKLVPPPGVVEELKKYLTLKPGGPNAQSAKEILSSLGK
jgi:tetratricopeptide (TPR) repeat protein